MNVCSQIEIRCVLLINNIINQYNYESALPCISVVSVVTVSRWTVFCQSLSWVMNPSPPAWGPSPFEELGTNICCFTDHNTPLFHYTTLHTTHCYTTTHLWYTTKNYATLQYYTTQHNQKTTQHSLLPNKKLYNTLCYTTRYPNTTNFVTQTDTPQLRNTTQHKTTQLNTLCYMD